MGKHRHTILGWPLDLTLRRLAVWLGSVGVLLLGFSIWSAWQAYQDIERVPFEDSATAAEVLETIPESEIEALREAEDAAEESARLAEQLELEAELLAQLQAERESQGPPAEIFENPFAHSPQLPDGMFTSYLLVGVEGGFRADAIMYLLQPSDGSVPIMLSLPRDLYLMNPCTQRYTRINAGLGGCAGYAGGAELLSLMVKDYTGIEVDHFARVDFSGFQRVINAIGGVEICLEHAVRDDKSLLDLPAGCSMADGEQALAWVRSRRTEQLIDGEWVRMPGVSDFTRQQKQQDMLFKIAGRLNSFSSFASFSEVASSLAGTVALDSGFSFGDALALAWDFRGISSSDVKRISPPVRDFVTGAGAYVLLPRAAFQDTLAAVYPPAG